MPKHIDDEPPLLSQEECEILLPISCINALRSHKLNNKTEYQTEISTLSKICAHLVSHYHESPFSIIDRMEKALEEAHNEEIRAIDHKIKHLFNIRKQTPANSFYCEQQIIKLTTEITILEERKNMPVKDTIQGIIHESLDQAIKQLGTEMPANFNLSLYEYHPVLNEASSSPKSNNPEHHKHGKGM